MYILIENKKEYTDQFIDFVIQYIFVIGMQNLDNKKQKLPAIDKYLNSIFSGSRKLFSYQIIVSGLKNILYKRTTKNIIIYLDNNVKLPLYRNINLVTICKLLDRGNIEIQPLGIFKYAFQFVKNNIEELYQLYDVGILI